jgi:hypothetical protein
VNVAALLFLLSFIGWAIVITLLLYANYMGYPLQ